MYISDNAYRNPECGHEVEQCVTAMDDINHGVRCTSGDLLEGAASCNDVSSLLSMVVRGRADEVRLRLAAGKPDLVNRPSASGDMLLHVAANTTHLDVIGVLLEHGAHVNRQRAGDKYAALHCAVIGGSVGAARCLLAAGADLTAANMNGNSALHLAAGIGNVELVGVLIAAGAPMERYNSNGNTPLANAVRNDHSSVVEVLLEAGANPSVLYAHKLTLLEIAMSERFPHVALQLLRHGATLPNLHFVRDWIRPEMTSGEILVFLGLVLSGNNNNTGIVETMDTSVWALQNARAELPRLPRALCTWVKTHASGPLQLNLLCRHRLRRLLLRSHPGALGAAIHRLLLPAPMTNFLLLADLDFIKTPVRISIQTGLKLVIELEP